MSQKWFKKSRKHLYTPIKCFFSVLCCILLHLQITTNNLSAFSFFSSRPHTACLSSRTRDSLAPRPVSARPRTPRETKAQSTIDLLSKPHSKRPVSAISTKSSIVDSLVIHEDASPGVFFATQVRIPPWTLWCCSYWLGYVFLRAFHNAFPKKL